MTQKTRTALKADITAALPQNGGIKAETVVTQLHDIADSATFPEDGGGGGGGSIADGDKGDITVSGSGTAWAVDGNAITNAKLADMATATIKGRTTAGTGDPEDLSVAQVQALLNVEDGATADQTGAEIVSAIDTELGGTTWQSGGSGSPSLASITDWPAAVSATEVGYLDGVTSAIQTQLDSAAQTYAQAIGDGAATSIAVTHNLGTRDVVVQVYNATTFAEVIPDVVRTDANTVTLTFETAPTSNQYRVVVQG